MKRHMLVDCGTLACVAAAICVVATFDDGIRDVACAPTMGTAIILGVMGLFSIVVGKILVWRQKKVALARIDRYLGNGLPPLP